MQAYKKLYNSFFFYYLLMLTGYAIAGVTCDSQIAQLLKAVGIYYIILATSFSCFDTLFVWSLSGWHIECREVGKGHSTSSLYHRSESPLQICMPSQAKFFYYNPDTDDSLNKHWAMACGRLC